MRFLAEHIARSEAPLTEVKRPCWVGEMRSELGAGRWRLMQGPRTVGTHDFVVIAHNGKCANRLLRPSGAPYVDAQMAAMRLNSVWCLMAAFAAPLGADFEGAFVEGDPALSWAANNTAKLGRVPGGTADDTRECWTLFSTAAYGRANKCPQESVPPLVSRKVTDDLLAALQKAIGAHPRPAWVPALAPANTAKLRLVHLQSFGHCRGYVPFRLVYAQLLKTHQTLHSCAPARLLPPLIFTRAGNKPLPEVVFTRTQLWGAALPTNAPGVGCIFDGEARVGMCGDWLLGANMEAAVLSAKAMADTLARAVADSHAAGRGLSLGHLSMGLQTPLRPIPGMQDIGTFGTTADREKNARATPVGVRGRKSRGVHPEGALGLCCCELLLLSACLVRDT